MPPSAPVDPWTWDHIEEYRLDEDDLKGYLRDRFGRYNFHIKVCTLLSIRLVVTWLTSGS